MSGPDDTSSTRVSIVTPVYNREDLVGPTIESVLSQDHGAWEMVVVDDGSTDGSAAAARRYAADDPRIRVYSHPNGGVATARNRGLQHTDRATTVVTFLDSDDLWLPDTLTTLVRALERHPDWVAVHGLARSVDDTGAPIDGDDLAERKRDRRATTPDGPVPLDPAEPTTFEAFLLDNWSVTPGTSAIRRAALDRIGAFDATVEPADDWDLNLRLARLGTVGFVDEVLLEWRQHPASLTRTSPRWRRAYFAVLDKAVADPANDRTQRAAARALYRSHPVDAIGELGRLVRSGDLRAAARQTPRCAYLAGRYVGAEIRGAVARARRSTS